MPTTGSIRTTARSAARRRRAGPPDSDDEAVVAGTLRSPWKWEELIVESAVVGGRSRADGKAPVAAAARRARGRLPLPDRRAEARGARVGAHRAVRARPAEPGAPARVRAADHRRACRLARRRRCGASGSIASATLAGRALQRPGARAADARRASADGRRRAGRRSRKRATSCTIGWSRSTGSRLLRRYGRLFVGTPHQARGRTFRVVFVPGLAERVVPQRPREDPLLLDDGARRPRTRALARPGRSGGAPNACCSRSRSAPRRERLYLSYPRLDVGRNARARPVVLRARRHAGDHRARARTIACWRPTRREEAGASLAWPAPADPDRAIDDLEHDLAVAEAAARLARSRRRSRVTRTTCSA